MLAIAAEGDLSGGIERPADACGAGAHRETGVIRNSRAGSRLPLPPDNVVSLLERAHGMRDAEDVAHVVNEALRLLGGSQREGLRDAFFPWLDQLAAQIGVDLGELEVKSMPGNVDADGEVRLMVEERLQASLDKMKAQSLEEGLERGLERARAEKLDLVRRMTARRFGADTARRLDPLLVGIKDPERLSSVFDWIIDCTTGPELLARLRHSD